MTDKEKTIEQNRALVERYPFLLPRSVFTDEVPDDYDYSYTLFDEIPKGWRDAFGLQMMEDLREDLINCGYLDEFRVQEIKEKYGSLRFYTGPIDMDSKAMDIIDRYERISVHTCIDCGKPDTDLVVVRGWDEPLCRECYEKRVEQEKQMGWDFKEAPAYEDLERVEVTFYSFDKDGNPIQ